MSLYSKEYWEGYEAAAIENYNCPYPKGSAEAEEWEKGQDGYDTYVADKHYSKKYF